MIEVPCPTKSATQGNDDSRGSAGHQPVGAPPDTLHLRSFMHAPAIIARLRGPEHVYEFVNQHHVEVLGERNYIGRTVRDVVPEAEGQGLIGILDRVYATGEPYVGREMALRFAHGSRGRLREGYYNFLYQPLSDETGAVDGIMIHAVEVTEEVLTRRRLEKLAAEQTAILSQMADAVIAVDASGRITLQNDAARRLLGVDGVGLSLEAWLATIQLLTVSGSPLPFDDTWLARTVLGGEPTLDVERRVRRPDGAEIVVRGSAMPVVADDGSRYGSVFSFRDITEQKRMEEARFALAALVESSSDAIITATIDGIITKWDRGAERLYGYETSEIIGEPLDMLVPLDRSAEVPSILERIRGGEQIEHLETVRRHKDGRLIDVSISISPLRDGSGTISGTLSIAHDIGERKRLERERANHQQELTTRVLQAQEDERKRIARELHDETVQALTTLLINLDVAERSVREGTSLGDGALGRVRTIARRALDESRSLAHSLRPPLLDDVGLEAALDALAEECMQTYHLRVTRCAESGSDARRRLEPYVETVLFRVAQEALTNSCKHAAADTVRISLVVDDRAATLTVKDNGRGFDLRQIKASGSRSGLGLDGMRERAELVAGELHIDTALGRGTAVTLRVPIDRTLAADLPDRHEDRAADGSTNMTTKVLLVDDHAMVREGLKIILEARPGIAVSGEAEDGRQALDMVQRVRPDVVVMDIAMPNLNGLDATRQLKRRFPEVKVLILTSHENRQYVTQIARTGAEGCLLKRSAGVELIEALETLRNGGRYVSPSIAGTLLADYRVRIDHGGVDLLTEREREVVQLVAEGHTNQGIARKLGISIKTVEAHRSNIMEKLGAADRTDLVKYAIRAGMISAD
jgi:PAS domain S-box-containing protein